MALVSRSFSCCFAVWFAVTHVLWGVAPAFAQQSIDLDPPLIEHEIIQEVESSVRQTFVATVVDDDELDSVRLFYRFAGEPTYSTVLMNRVSFSSSYIAQINTDPATETAIEYYIQAMDRSGNRTVRGYAFNPLVRLIVLNEEITNANASVEEPTPVAAEPAKKPKKALYIVLGVLAVGLLAGLAGGSGGGGGGGCDDDGCKIDIDVELPVVTQ